MQVRSKMEEKLTVTTSQTCVPCLIPYKLQVNGKKDEGYCFCTGYRQSRLFIPQSGYIITRSLHAQYNTRTESACML